MQTLLLERTSKTVPAPHRTGAQALVRYRRHLDQTLRTGAEAVELHSHGPDDAAFKRKFRQYRMQLRVLRQDRAAARGSGAGSPREVLTGDALVAELLDVFAA